MKDIEKLFWYYIIDLCFSVLYTSWVFAGGESKFFFGFLGIICIIGSSIMLGRAIERLNDKGGKETNKETSSDK